jgi:hypothetical protein
MIEWENQTEAQRWLRDQNAGPCTIHLVGPYRECHARYDPAAGVVFFVPWKYGRP